jgi:small subunit ribosomal protein S1
MSWKRVSTPSDVVKVGDVVRVQIIKLNKEAGRISLGMKQLGQTPWENVEKRFVIGQKYTGRIVNLTEYGAFVELEDCIEGMIYMTELSWTRKNIHPSKIVSVGDIVEVMVLDVNSQKRKISLGLKQCQENPWQKFAETNPVGTRLHGVVKNITEFGVFVGVTDCLDGMIHISDLSWSGVDTDGAPCFQRGQSIDVVVLDVNPEKERINLGVKQLEENPYAALSSLKKNTVVVAEVAVIHNSGLEVRLENGASGFVKKVDLSVDKLKQRPEDFSVGSKIEAVILLVDRQARKVYLSVRAMELYREKQAVSQFGSTDKGGTSLGDILSAALKKSEENEENEDKETGGPS